MNTRYKNIHGTWSVTTEGDVEGRSVRQLGTFTGFVDEIALHLADKCYYSLTFKKIEPVKEFTPKKEKVHVQFDIDSGTWDSIKKDEGLAEVRRTFSDRPVTISESNYYASFLIESHNADEQQALSKLSEEEKRALGF